MKSSSSLFVVGASEHISFNCSHTIISNAIKACFENVTRCHSKVSVYSKEEIMSTMSTSTIAFNTKTSRGKAALIVKCSDHTALPLLTSQWSLMFRNEAKIKLHQLSKFSKNILIYV